MSISTEDLKHIANLAYLDVDAETSPTLIKELNNIMDFADKLRLCNTDEVLPLFHPLSLQQQALRVDEVTEEDCSSMLAAIAPAFEDHLYLVPKVIEVEE
jgi:aspartyl-tRNA(Asn)/glutamyl-tRNA(Gln) amidotransferase subunit C